MHYIIKYDEPWIPCTCNVDTRNANLHNLQHTRLQADSDVAAAPAHDLEIPEAAVAAIINTPVAGPWVAPVAAAMIKTPPPVAVGLTPITMSNGGTTPEGIMAVMRAWKAS